MKEHNDVVIFVPTFSYGRLTIDDILNSLGDIPFNTLSVHYNKLIVHINHIRIRIFTSSNIAKLDGLRVDFVFGADANDTIHFTDGKQTRPCFSFTRLISYLRDEIIDAKGGEEK